MSKFTKGAMALRKLGRGGFKGLGDALNMGKWATNVARGFGIKTHNKAPIISTRQMFKDPQMEEQIAAATKAGKNPIVPQDAYKSVHTLGEKSLTGTGVGLQVAGNAAMYGGAGTLAYNMNKGDGTEAGHDENGIKNPQANEEMVKFREKFQKEKLGGSNVFSGAKYKALRGQSKWVDTAIKSIGKEKYMKMRTAVMNGDLPPEKLHSFLTDSIAHDTEALKLAGKDPYVLPGIAKTGGGESRVIVMAPMAGKDKKTSYKAMQYGIDAE